MGRSLFDQNTQVHSSGTYTDSGSAGSTLESGASTLEDDLNSLRAQVKRILDDSSGNWYDDVPTVNSKKRSMMDLNTDLDDIEEKRLLFRTQVLTDISVPAEASATGTLTLNSNILDTETVTIDTKTYTFQDTLTEADGNVHIGDTASDTLDNFIAAINLSGGTAGVDYASAMTEHPTCSAAAGAGDTMDVTAETSGTAGNTIATTETIVDVLSVWGGATLSGGAGDIVVLSVSSSETPSQTASVGAVTTEGAVVAYNSGFSNHSTAEVTGPNALRPDNLCVIRDTTTSEPIVSSNGKEIWALLQSESNSDGHTIDDSSNQVMLAFVEENSDGDDLILVDAADIGGETINYSYVRRIAFDNIPESAFLQGVFVDQVATTDVTLDNAIDNQSGVATQAQNIDWNVADTYEFALTADSGGTDVFKYSPTSGGNTILLAPDTLDINVTNAVDIDEPLKVDTDGTEIDIGVNAGYIETTSTDNLTINGAGELFFDDGNRSGSTFSTAVKLSDTQAEWNAYETEFGGEVSILAALVAASDAVSRTKGVASVITGDIAADTNVTGAGGSPNISAQLPDYSGVTWATDVDVFVNGALQYNGADAAANNDVYPGTSAANGDLKFEYALKYRSGTNPDVITVIVWG